MTDEGRDCRGGGGGVAHNNAYGSHWPLKMSYQHNAGTERSAGVSLVQMALYNEGWEGGAGGGGGLLSRERLQGGGVHV